MSDVLEAVSGAVNSAAGGDTALKLDQLSDVRERLAALPAELNAAIDDLLLFEDALRQQVADVRAQFAAQAAELTAQARFLEETIKASTLLAGHTLKSDGGRLQCVWSKPSVKWNDDKLTGYATAHPEILAFRTVGKPSVAIR